MNVKCKYQKVQLITSAKADALHICSDESGVPVPGCEPRFQQWMRLPKQLCGVQLDLLQKLSICCGECEKLRVQMMSFHMQQQ